MRLVYGIERDFGLLEEEDVFFLIECLGCDVEELGNTGEDVVFYGGDLFLVERGVEEVGNSVVATGGSEAVDLIFHQGDEGRNDDGGTRKNKGGELVAK